jgi:peptidoglycan L-alanyl-D-glutamate endopeptidase CwlK
MNFKLSDRSKGNRIGVRNELIEISDRAIEITMVDFGHGTDSGMRTAERQKELYDKGLSKADGYINKSNHQTGDALDFFAFVDGKASWEPLHLAMVASAFLQSASELGYVIEWGGLWRGRDKIHGWDMPHIQYIGRS